MPWFAMILDGLELSPSEFFSRFAKVLPETLPADPLPLQQSFVSDQFEHRRQSEVAALAVDLIAYFGAVEPLLTPPAVKSKPDSTSGELYLNPHSIFVHFNHDPQQLLQHLADDITDLQELAFFVPRVDCDYFCYLFQDTLEFYPLNPVQSAYLKSLDSCTSATAPSPDFVAEALKSGILFRHR